MRLFTGIAIPEPIYGNLSHLLDQLRPAASIHWSPAGNFHVTTKFVGEFTRDRLPELTSLLEGLAHYQPPRIEVKGVGWFPNSRAPRVFFAAITPVPELLQLADATDQALSTLGIARETRQFSPHLTLARIRDATVSLTDLRQAVSRLPGVDFGSFAPSAFHLYESRPGRAGSIYTQLAEIPFEQ